MISELYFYWGAQIPGGPGQRVCLSPAGEGWWDNKAGHEIEGERVALEGGDLGCELSQGLPCLRRRSELSFDVS